MWSSTRAAPAAVLMILLAVAVPAAAVTILHNRMSSETVAEIGPQFFPYRSGTPVDLDSSTEWTAANLDGVTETGVGAIEIGDPSGPTWFDASFERRQCFDLTNPAAPLVDEVVSIFVDTTSLIAAESFPSPVRNLQFVHSGAGALRYRVVGPVPDVATEIMVELPTVGTNDPEPLCMYWDSPSASSSSDLDVGRLPIVDTTMTWRRWNNATQNNSPDSVDWNGTPTVDTTVATADTPGLNRCTNCGLELAGFIEAPATGNYTFWLATDDAGELNLSTDTTEANFVEIATVPGWARRNQWTKYVQQRSAPIPLVAGQRYALQARARENGGRDHIQIAWTRPDGTFEIIPGSSLAPTVDGPTGSIGFTVQNSLTRLAPEDRPSDDTVIVQRAASGQNTCDNCRHDLTGWVIAPEGGDYTFYLSSNNYGSLGLGPTDDPADLETVADVPWFSNFNQWTKYATQRTRTFTLAKGDALYIQATAFERTAGDHVQVGWIRPSEGVGTIGMPPRQFLSSVEPIPVPSIPTTAGPVQSQGGRGAFESVVFDTGASGSMVFGLFEWSGAEPAGTNARFQVAFSPGPAGPWDYVGPGNDPTMWFEETSSIVDYSHDGSRYVRIRGELTSSDPAVSPRIDRVSIGSNLVELASSPEASPAIPVVSNWTLPGAERQPVLRVKSTDPTAAAMMAETPLIVDLTIETDLPNLPQTIFTTVVSGDGVQRTKWIGLRADGIQITHTFDLTVDPVLPALQLISCDRFTEDVVLRNTTPSALNLAGWRLFDDGTATVDLGTLQAQLGPNETVTVITGPTVRPGLRWRFSNVWNNGGDTAHLESPLGDPQQDSPC